MNFSKQNTMTFLSDIEQQRLATLGQDILELKSHAVDTELRLNVMQHDLDIAEQAIATQYELIKQLEKRVLELEPC